jgi:hypothetical protein
MDAYFYTVCPLRQLIPLHRCRAATDPLGRLHCANLRPSLSSGKRRALLPLLQPILVQGLAAIPLVTIGVTNAEKSPPTAMQMMVPQIHGMDFTWLTARHAPVIASLPSPDSGSRGAGLVSQRSLHPPTSVSEVLRRPDHEMPKLPVVRSRQSRFKGQPSQAAGALIPDNTQHSWRDDVGKVLQL